MMILPSAAGPTRTQAKFARQIWLMNSGNFIDCCKLNLAQFKRARGAEFNLDGVKMKATQAPSKNEILRHIDKTGVERVLDDKATSGDHGLKYRLQKDDNLRQDIIKALNSINQIAPHKNIQNRMTATSDNGYFLVFDSTRIITAFKPEKGAKEYFKENSVTLKQEVIKSKIFKLWWKK